MKIINITECYGGGVKTHLDYIKKFFNIDVEIYVFAGDANNLNNPKLKVLKGDRKNILSLISSIVFLHKELTRENNYIVHAHSTIAGIIGVILKMMNFKRKIIFTPHAYYSQKKELTNFKKLIITIVEKMIVKYSDVVIHVSKEEEQHAVNVGILPNERTLNGSSYVIYNGVEMPQNALSKEYNPQKIIIGNLARFNHQKNPFGFFQIAVELIEKLKAENIEVAFVWAGEGPLLNDLKEKVEEHDLSSYFYFPGPVSKINIDVNFFGKIDYFMSSSHYEGMPYSVIEALSYSKPLILSNVVGHSELIDNNGTLFDVNKPATNIAKDIVSFINSNEYIKLKKASNELFLNKFEIDLTIDNLNAIYTKLLSE